MNIYKEMSDNRKSTEQKGTHIFDGFPMYQCKQLCAHINQQYTLYPLKANGH